MINSLKVRYAEIWQAKAASINISEYTRALPPLKYIEAITKAKKSQIKREGGRMIKKAIAWTKLYLSKNAGIHAIWK